REGPVFALGADGLGLAKQRFDPARRDFVVLGSIEPRKNLPALLEAFQGLWREGMDVRLVLLGRIIGAPEREQAMLASLAAEPRLTFIQEPDETVVRSALSRARALLAASIAEGFGLPPFEALAAGIPVIAPADMPSIRLLPPGGQVRLKGTSAAEIADAVRLLRDDVTAQRLFAEAAGLRVPTWADFSAALAAWLHEA
ncbi:MAG: glycosyltransferase, partial [Acetobacteraceae bacterium]